ncbi:hypothetical protein GCM10023339_76280 [Alloalcanivorax gelatiniphagus]
MPQPPTYTTARFAPFAVIAPAVLKDTNLSAPAKLGYCAIAAFAKRSTRTTYVSLKTVALITGTRPEAVSGMKQKLAAAGWLSSARRCTGGRRTTDLTTLRDLKQLEGQESFGLAAVGVLSDVQLTPGARVLYAAMTALATRDDRNLRWRSESELAELVGSQRRESVAEWVKALEAAGYLRVTRASGFNSQYELLDDHLLAGAQESVSPVTTPVRENETVVRETASEPVRETGGVGTDPGNTPMNNCDGSTTFSGADRWLLDEAGSHVREVSNGSDGLNDLVAALRSRERPIADGGAWLIEQLSSKDYKQRRALCRSLWHSDINHSTDDTDLETMVETLSSLGCGGHEDMLDGTIPAAAQKMWESMTEQGIDWPGSYLREASWWGTNWAGVDSVLQTVELEPDVHDWLDGDLRWNQN